MFLESANMKDHGAVNQKQHCLHEEIAGATRHSVLIEFVRASICDEEWHQVVLHFHHRAFSHLCFLRINSQFVN